MRSCLDTDVDPIFLDSSSLLRKKKLKNSPVLTMSRKCEKIHVRFCY